MKKINFNLDDFENVKYAVHCPEKWQAELFCNFLDESGLQWSDGKKYSEYTFWNAYTDKTCYNVNGRGYSPIDYYFANEYEIFNIEDFIVDDEQLEGGETMGEKYIDMDLNAYQGKYAMLCPEKWQAELFCEFLDSQGRAFRNGDKYTDVNTYDEYDIGTCYGINDGTFGDAIVYLLTDYTILNIEYFIKTKETDIMTNTFTKNDLRTGMVATLKNGNKYMVLLNCKGDGSSFDGKDVMMSLDRNKFICLDRYDHNLNHDTYDNFQIVEIETYSDFNFLAECPNENLHTMWKRDQRVKMTLEQIEQELGKKIELIG